jgi:hypothetical protein
MLPDRFQRHNEEERFILRADVVRGERTERARPGADTLQVLRTFSGSADALGLW